MPGYVRLQNILMAVLVVFVTFVLHISRFALLSKLQIKILYLKLQSCNAYGTSGAFAKRKNSSRALHYHRGKYHSKYSMPGSGGFSCAALHYCRGTSDEQ